jgi:outer membrane protein assembly factor BamB
MSVRTFRNLLLAATLVCGPIAGSFSAWADEDDWPDYRHDRGRSGEQERHSALSDPAKVPGLAVRWQWPPSAGGEGGSFYASPIVIDGRVFIGSTSGRFYALDAKTGALLWQFPPGPQPLLGSCTAGGVPQSFGAYGVLSSASQYERLVIFGAPDPDPAVDGGLGSGRLWAVEMSTGALAWKSDVLARVNGCTPGATSEQHERIGYSSPLVREETVYVGIHDAGDNPIQNGKLLAVNAKDGHLRPGFAFLATSDRGGGVWNAPAALDDDVLFTTGNTADGVVSEPVPNRGLSMIRIDGHSGALDWQFQPVPFALDDDPDWAAGVTVMHASCGGIAASVMKDGWTYALRSSDGACRWQFPATLPQSAACKFPAAGAHVHGDTDYKRPGAAWGDVLAIVTGGEGLVTAAGVTAGYGRLHGLNACASTPAQRARWIADVPNSSGSGYSLGAPSVTRGIFYIGTDQGHIVAFGDPSVVTPAGVRCSQVFTPVASCVASGFSLVWAPAVLANVNLGDGSSAAGLRSEPALSEGRLFAATLGGHVYMLSP